MEPYNACKVHSKTTLRTVDISMKEKHYHINENPPAITTSKEELLGEQKEYKLSPFQLQAAEPSGTLSKLLGSLSLV